LKIVDRGEFTPVPIVDMNAEPKSDAALERPLNAVLAMPDISFATDGTMLPAAFTRPTKDG
jgi:hypothetical protein